MPCVKPYDKGFSAFSFLAWPSPHLWSEACFPREHIEIFNIFPESQYGGGSDGQPRFFSDSWLLVVTHSE